MRLPWPFGRQQPDATPPAADVFSARPRGAEAWRDLPVLERSVGEPPLMAPVRPFRNDLAGAAPAPVALAPLTHARGLDAPSGLVGNIVSATNPSTVAAAQDREARSALMPTHRRPRHEQLPDISEALDDPAPSVPGPASPAPAPASPAPGPASPLVGEARAASPSVTTPIARRAPVAASSSATRASMVRADQHEALPGVPVGRIGPARPAVASVQRAPAAVPVPTSSAPPSVTQPVKPHTAAAESSSSERLTLGQSRRRGLGAPIDASLVGVNLPLTAASSAPADLSTRVPLVLNSAPAPMPAPDPTAPSALAPHMEGSPVQGLVSDSPVTASTPSASSGQSHPAPSPAIAAPIKQRPSRAAAVAQSSKPLVGVRPMKPPVQRAPIAAPTGSSGAAADAAPSRKRSSSATDAVRIHRGSEATNLSGAFDARAFTHGGEIYLPDSHGPLSGQKAQSLLAHEMTHVSQQRKFGSNLPHEDSPEGRQMEAQAVAAESSYELPLALPSEKTATPAPSEASRLSATPADLHSGSPAATPARDHSQRASANDAKWKDPDDAFRAQLDSNEDYLFDRFERRLRYVLIHERERGGTLIDAL